jgi:hypothetical protein
MHFESDFAYRDAAQPRSAEISQRWQQTVSGMALA